MQLGKGKTEPPLRTSIGQRERDVKVAVTCTPTCPAPATCCNGRKLLVPGQQPQSACSPWLSCISLHCFHAVHFNWVCWSVGSVVPHICCPSAILPQLFLVVCELCAFAWWPYWTLATSTSWHVCLCLEIFGLFNTKPGNFRCFVFTVTCLMAAVRGRAPQNIVCFVDDGHGLGLFLRHGLLPWSQAWLEQGVGLWFCLRRFLLSLCWSSFIGLQSVFRLLVNYQSKCIQLISLPVSKLEVRSS